MFPTKTKLTIAAALAVTALAAVPTSSMAGLTAGPLEYEPVTKTVASFSEGTAVALCSQPQQVVGGGGAISAKDLGPSDQDTVVTMSSPFDGADLGPTPDDGYHTAAYNDSGVGRKVKTMAVCFRDGSQPDYASNPQTSGGSHFSQAVGCSGTPLLGGGAYIEGPHVEGSRLRGSYPYDSDDANERPDDGWTYSANRNAGAGGTIAAHAICSGTGGHEVRYRSDDATVGASKTRAVRVACPRRFHASGGGVFGEPGMRVSMPYDGADGDEAPDDGWRVTVYNTEDVPLPIEAHAICLR